MTTKYFCATCKTVFDDHDPVSFGNGPASYPACPKGVTEAYKLFQDNDKSPEFWQGKVTFGNPQMQAMAVASRKHKVDLQVTEAVPVLAVLPQPEPPKVLSFVDKLKLNLGNAPQPVTKPVGMPLWKPKSPIERAQELLSWVDKCCNGTNFGTSVGYPNDRLYPVNGERYETAEVIALARNAWNMRAANLNHHAMAPQFKDDWRQRTEVDFIRDITLGGAGRHIAHVILGTKGEKGWIPV